MGNKMPQKENFPKETPIVAVCGGYDFTCFYRMDTGERIRDASVNTGRSHSMIKCRLGDESVLAVGTVQCGMRQPVKRLRSSGEEVQFETGRILATPRFTKHTGTIYAIEDLPSSFGEDRMVTSGDSTVRVWKKTDGTQIVVLGGHERSVVSLCCVPSKKWVVGGSRDTSILVWDLETGKTVPDGIIYEHEALVNVTMSGGEQRPCIMSGSDDGTIRMFSLDGLKCDRTFKLPVATGCYSLLFHPAREYLFYAGCFTDLFLWDVRKEDRWVEKKDGFHGVERLSRLDAITRIVSAGPGLFVSCSEDSTIKVWTEKLKPFPTPDQDVVTTPGKNYGLVVLVPFAVSPPSSELLEDGSGVVQAQKLEEERIRFLAASVGLPDCLGVHVRLGGLLLRSSPGLGLVE